MWTYLPKQHKDRYLNEHPGLSENFNQICLLETKDACFLPRLMFDNYPSNTLIKYDGKKIIDPEPVSFKFTGELRQNQVPIAETVMNHFQAKGSVNGIIRARPGIGKTVTSVYIASKIGLKTCIIVDNSNLLEQWIKAIFDFTDLTENDIGIIQQKLTVTNKPVTIAMCQSLLSKLKTSVQSAFEFVSHNDF